jgi:CrcB protein
VNLLLVGGGGALGCVCRYLLASSLGERFGIPYGTLAVNLLGSFALALLMSLSGRSEDPQLRLLLGTGFMGGFTTYSTFNLETLRLLEAGDWRRAALYLGLTLVGCMAGALLGLALGRTVS